MKRFIFLIFLQLNLIFASQTTSQELDLLNFTTDDGQCNRSQKSELLRASLGETLTVFRSYNTVEVSLEKQSGISQPTQNTLRPLQTVICLVKSGDKMLVTTSDPADKSCGWVRIDSLKAVKIKSSLFSSSLAPCGDIAPMSVSEFCSKVKKFKTNTGIDNQASQRCSLINKYSSISIRFVPIGSITNLYLSAEDEKSIIHGKPERRAKEIKEIYDVVYSQRNGWRVLLGVDGVLQGWADLRAGMILHSNLYVYFREGGKGIIEPQMLFSRTTEKYYSDMKSVSTAPEDKDFAKFPVVIDLRRQAKSGVSTFAPQIKIGITKGACEFVNSNSDPKDVCGSMVGSAGYILTSKIGVREENWDYFVALKRGELSDIKRLAEDACSNLGTGDSVETATDAIIGIVQILTGDDKTPEELVKQLQEGSIPLQTQTIIGEGMADFLLRSTTGERLEDYKKEFCRTEILLDGMQRGTKIMSPEDGEDIVWNGDFYDLVGGEEFDWVFTDDLGREVFYLPVKFLPRAK